MAEPDSTLDETPENPAPTPSRERISWIRRAQAAVRAHDAPTWGLDLRAIGDGVEKARSRSVVDLAMRIAESTLSTGASAADVTANVLAVTRAYGLTSVHVDVTFTAIAVTHHRGAGQDPVTMIRTVRVRITDYERLAETHALVDAITGGDLDLEAARERFAEIMGRAPQYRRAIITASSAMLGGGVAGLLGGGLAEILLATITSGLVHRVLLWASRQRLAAFFGQMLGGAIPTVVAMVLIATAMSFPEMLGTVRPSLIVSAGIVMLLSGMSVVGAAQDAIDGYYVTAAARSFEVFVRTLGIVVGVVTVLTIGQRLGVPFQLLPPSTVAADLGVQLIAVVAIAAAFAVGSYSGPPTVAVSMGVGVLAWLTSAVVLHLDFDTFAASACAGLAVGIASQVAAAGFRVPSVAVGTAGIVALLPGSLVYRGLYYVVSPAPVESAATDGTAMLWQAVGIGIALAAGVSLGSYFGRRLRWDVRSRSRAHQNAMNRAPDGA